MQDYTGNVNGPVLWNLNLLDARLNPVSESYGNGLWLQNGFDALTGMPLSRQAGTGGQSSNVQNLSYAWDTAGNLSNRQDLRQTLTESFTYDALDRLTLASGPAGQSTAIGYDAIGNLSSKTGVGSYAYHATRKHAVINAGGSAYAYDGNGNLTSRSGATVTWTSYNLPSSIADPNGYSAQFTYAPDRSRWKQTSSYAGGTETTIYVGGLLEKLTTPTRTHYKHLIATPSGEVQLVRRSDGTADTYYVTTDHLGSTEAVLNAAGTVLMRGSFTVHGARRASNWQGAPSSTEWQAIADTTRLGYTGHQQIDNVMLVHMNGRVFDPVIGRFLSADPYVDGPESTQGWNRYAYVHGRLMSATDPSGFVNSLMWEFSMGRLIKRIDLGPTSSSSRNGGDENTPSEFVGGPGAIGISVSFVRGSRGGILYPPTNGMQLDDLGNYRVSGARPIFTMGSVGDFFSMSVTTGTAEGHTGRDGGGSGGGGSNGRANGVAEEALGEVIVEAIREQKKCLNETYGNAFDIAYAMSIFQIADFVASATATDWADDELSKQANRNKYQGAGRRQGEAGNRQLRTLSQFRRFNQAMAVAGAAGTGIVIGANIYCAFGN